MDDDRFVPKPVDFEERRQEKPMLELEGLENMRRVAQEKKPITINEVGAKDRSGMERRTVPQKSSEYIIEVK